MYSPAWPHSAIQEIFPDIFFVMGTNITKYQQVELQHSRNMLIIREQDKLSLINTVRLDEAGLKGLEALGQVEAVLRIGAFHGRDDAFYLDRYPAKLWALAGMQHEGKREPDYLLMPQGKLPFSQASLFQFESSVFPEGILHLAREGGILITCDSLKNWVDADEFFSQDSALRYAEQEHFGIATISRVWKEASQVKAEDFIRLKALRFKHLLSAHGEPLKNTAYQDVAKTILKEFGV